MRYVQRKTLKIDSVKHAMKWMEKREETREIINRSIMSNPDKG